MHNSRWKSNLGNLRIALVIYFNLISTVYDIYQLSSICWFFFLSRFKWSVFEWLIVFDLFHILNKSNKNNNNFNRGKFSSNQGNENFNIFPNRKSDCLSIKRYNQRQKGLDFLDFDLQYLTKILRPIPLPQLSMFLASIWDRFLAQASVLLLFRYAAALSRRKEPDLFLQNGSFQNFHKFFQSLTWYQ